MSASPRRPQSGRRPRTPSSRLETLEPRRLLAAAPVFPDAAILGSNWAGWNFADEAAIKEPAPPTLDSTAPDAAPLTYAIQFSGAAGAVPVRAVSWGAHSTGFGVGQLAFDPFTVTVDGGRYSTGLIQATAGHTRFDTVTVTGADATGRPAAQWVLANATLGSYATSQSAGAGNHTTDSFALTFDKVTQSYTTYLSSGMPVTYAYTYDAVAKQAVASGAVHDPSVGNPLPTTTIDLLGQTLAVDSLTWAESNDPADIAGGQAVPGEFAVSLAGGVGATQLIGQMVLAKFFPSAVLKTRDAAGHVVSQWDLSNLKVESFTTSDTAGSRPTDSITLSLKQIKLTRSTYNPTTGALTSTHTGGWDFNAHKALNTTATLAGNTYGPGDAVPAETMQIDGATTLIPVDSFSFGASFDATTPDVAQLADISISLPGGPWATGLLETVAAADHHTDVTLISRNPQGKEVLRYTLSNASFDSFASSTGPDGASPLSLNVHYPKIKVEWTPYDGKGNPLPRISHQYDVTIGHTETDSSIHGQTFAPGAEPRLALDAGNGLIPLYNIDWVLDRPSGQPFDPSGGTVTLSLPTGAGSPDLFFALANAPRRDALTVSSFDGHGNVTGSWSFDNAEFDGYGSAQSSGATGFDTLSFTFAAVTRTVTSADFGKQPVTYVGGWDFGGGHDLGNGTLAGLTYPPGAEPLYSLQIVGQPGLLPVDAFAWGDTLTSAPAMGASVVSIAPFTLLLPGGRLGPALIPIVAAHRNLGTVIVTRRDTQGRLAQRWTLRGVTTSHLEETATNDGAPGADVASLSATGATVEYFPYADDGAALPPITGTFDLTDTSATKPGYGGQTFPPGARPEMTVDFGNGSQIAVDSFAWAETPTGGGPNHLGPVPADFSFSTSAGVASPGLTLGAFQKTLPTVTLTLRDPYGNVQARWLLSDVFVTSYSTSAGGGGVPSEFFTLNPRDVELEYRALAPAAAVDPITPAARNTTVPSATIRFSEPVTGFDLKDLTLTRGNNPNNLLTPQQTLTPSDGGRTWTLGNLTPLQSADGQYLLTILTGPVTAVVGASTHQTLAQSTAGTWLLDRVAPAVTATVFDFAASPQRVRITFGEDVGASLAAADLTWDPYAGQSLASLPPITGFSYDAPTRTGIWTFAGKLPDGNYRVTLPTAGVTDPAGNALAAKTTLEFFVLAGDATRDRKVNFDDLVKLAQNYNTTGRTYVEGDFTGDGKIDFNDLVVLAQHYNTSLALPGGAVPSALSAIAAAPMPPLATVFAAQTKKQPPPKVFSITPLPKPAPKKAPAPRKC